MSVQGPGNGPPSAGMGIQGGSGQAPPPGQSMSQQNLNQIVRTPLLEYMHTCFCFIIIWFIDKFAWVSCVGFPLFGRLFCRNILGGLRSPDSVELGRRGISQVMTIAWRTWASMKKPCLKSQSVNCVKAFEIISASVKDIFIARQLYLVRLETRRKICDVGSPPPAQLMPGGCGYPSWCLPSLV